jgi:alpha-beta hydrolase superfamily lysophospholipase
MQIALGSKGTGGNFDFEAMRCLGIASMGGAGVGESLAAIGRIRRGDVNSWANEFGALGDRLTGEAEGSLRARDSVSAVEQLTRASTYYRIATLFLPHQDERQHRYRSASREVFQRAIHGGGKRNVDVLRIPFDGATLPGYFVSAGEGPHPTLIVLGGYDSTAEELMLWIGNACASRGFNALVFEGPGQVGAVDLNPGLVFRPDYEVPVRAAIDHVIGRPDVDPDGLAILGYSFGGCLAPRAATGDPRIRAVVANTLGVDIPGAFRMALPAMLWKLPDYVVDGAFGALTHASVTARFFLESAKDAFGTQSGSEFLKALEPYNLWSVQSALTVPLLVMITEDEIAEAPKQLVRDTLEFSAGLRGPVAFRVFTREEGATAHCQLDSPERMPPALFPWLARALGDGALSEEVRRVDVESLEQLARLIEKHHGPEFGALVEKLAKKSAS